MDRRRISEIFRIKEEQITRPTSGEVDLLIGLQYAAYHPAPVEVHGHLILYSNRFGKVVGGSHPEIRERTRIDDICAKARVSVSMHVRSPVDTFFEIEGLGVVMPRIFRGYPGPPDNPGQIHYPLSVYPLSVLTPDSKTDSKRQKRKNCLFSHEKLAFVALFSTIFLPFFDHFFKKEIASSHASLSRPKITIEIN